MREVRQNISSRSLTRLRTRTDLERNGRDDGGQTMAFP